MTILWSLQMPTAQKIGLGLVLTLSILYVKYKTLFSGIGTNDETSAFGASIAKCIAIGNLGKGDLTCKTNLLYNLNLC